MKKYKWEQEQIADMKEYIARFGHGSAKLARQAQSKEKTLEKMVQSPAPVPLPQGRVKLPQHYFYLLGPLPASA